MSGRHKYFPVCATYFRVKVYSHHFFDLIAIIFVGAQGFPSSETGTRRLCCVLPVALLLDARLLLRALVAGDARGAPLGLLLVANGSAHALYNGVSFVVLNRVSVATHAVLNIMRRVCVIGFAAAAFGTPVSLFNWAGIALAAFGVSAFAEVAALLAV